MYSNYYI